MNVLKSSSIFGKKENKYVWTQYHCRLVYGVVYPGAKTETTVKNKTQGNTNE